MPWKGGRGLSLVACVTMLGATELVATELGSSPLAWVGPFAAYLLSFMVVFSGKCPAGMRPAAAIGLIPEELEPVTISVGNAAGEGAVSAAVSEAARQAERQAGHEAVVVEETQ